MCPDTRPKTAVLTIYSGCFRVPTALCMPPTQRRSTTTAHRCRTSQSGKVENPIRHFHCNCPTSLSGSMATRSIGRCQCRRAPSSIASTTIRNKSMAAGMTGSSRFPMRAASPWAITTVRSWRCGNGRRSIRWLITSLWRRLAGRTSTTCGSFARVRPYTKTRPHRCGHNWMSTVGSGASRKSQPRRCRGHRPSSRAPSHRMGMQSIRRKHPISRAVFPPQSMVIHALQMPRSILHHRKPSRPSATRSRPRAFHGRGMPGDGTRHCATAYKPRRRSAR